MAVFGASSRQRLDRTSRPAHGVALEGVTEAEQDEQQSAFRPLAKRARAGGGHQHQGVDLEPAPARRFSIASMRVK